MAKFKVLQKCYFGEGGQKHRLMYAGEIYESNTLKAKDTPKYLQPIDGVAKKAEVEVTEPSGDSPMGYHEMKSFVAENDIEVADYKQPTLEAAIAAWKAGGKAEVTESEVEAEVEVTEE